ncbi:MAG: alpha/beta hydrolase [Actinobacteria bacterium]|nr:alpha/beta hydrolase [Actinomycetota bacterium]
MEVQQERVAVADGVALHVERRPGDGLAFLLVHGLASNLHLWDGVAARLADLGHAVAAVDQRGHGRSDKPDDGYELTTVTDDLARLVDVLGFDRPVLVGQSWGANVVLEAAWRFPGLTRGVACVDGGWIELRRRFPDWQTCVEALAPPATAGRPATEIEGWLRRRHPDWTDTSIAGALNCFEHLPDGTVAPWLSLERHLAILAGLWEHSPTSRYPEVEVPVLLVPARSSSAPDGSSGEDRRRQVEAAAASLPRCRVRWMSGDHDLHAHHPEELATLLHEATVDGFLA